jgi:hypothetical protein
MARLGGQCHAPNCTTCARPEAQRAEVFARIALYAKRAALRLPLFDHPSEAAA